MGTERFPRFSSSTNDQIKPYRITLLIGIRCFPTLIWQKIRNRGLKTSPVKEVPMKGWLVKGKDYSSTQPLVYNYKTPKRILRLREQ